MPISIIYLIAFSLSQLRTWNNVQTDKAQNSQTQWRADRDSQAGWVSTHNLQIIWLAIHRLANPTCSQFHILESLQFRLCVHRDVNIIV